MTIRELLRNVDYQVLQGSDYEEVKAISWDTRSIVKGSVFICVKGKNVDRHDYALQAIEEGAMALIVEREIKNIPRNITVIKVENSKAVMAILASEFYHKPSTKFNLIGITGTNGKTSTSYFIANILEALGRKVGIIGTIENTLGDKILEVEKKNPTTPDSIELQSSFQEMLKNNVTDVVMEVSSIALVEHRVDQCDFDIGVFTNLTQDHLDEHGSMENYKDAKLKLFKMCKLGIINLDDSYAEEFIREATCMVYTYGIDKAADYRALQINYTLEGVSFTLSYKGEAREVTLRVPGKFSVYNALAAIASVHRLGLPLEDIIKGIASIGTVRGRFETVSNNKGCMVVVDYAHTPDGLLNILSALRALAKRKVIAVFGCGGDRDSAKRPLMGETAGSLADYVILTSDNPRTENPTAILQDIEQGIKKTSCSYKIIEDRKEAIYAALAMADKEDIVVIAGKGHETYQIFKNETIHFDDAEIVRQYIL